MPSMTKRREMYVNSNSTVHVDSMNSIINVCYVQHVLIMIFVYYCHSLTLWVLTSEIKSVFPSIEK